MKKYALIAMAFLPLPCFAQVDCQAISRSVDGKRQESKPLAFVGEDKDMVRWNAEIAEVNYSVYFDKSTEDYLVLITRGTKVEGSDELVYENGTALRGTFNKKHMLNASLVTPTDVYQIHCVEK